MTRQWYTTRRRGCILRRPEGPRARSRFPLRARSRGDATLLSRPPRAHRDRRGQGRAHRLLLGRRPPSRRLVRAGARRGPRAAAEGCTGPLSHRLRRRELARRARGRPALGRGARAHAVRRDAELVLRARSRRPRDRALRRSWNLSPARDAIRARVDEPAAQGMSRRTSEQNERVVFLVIDRRPAIVPLPRRHAFDRPDRLDGRLESHTQSVEARPRVRHSPRSTRRSASAASIACRRWGGSTGFATQSNAPNARLRLASSAFVRSCTMTTLTSGARATIVGSTPTPLSPAISTSSSTMWGARSTT